MYSDSLRAGSKAEVARALAKAGWPSPEYSFGKRYTQKRYSVCGHTVAQIDQTLTRGKVTSELYSVNPAYLV